MPREQALVRCPDNLPQREAHTLVEPDAELDALWEVQIGNVHEDTCMPSHELIGGLVEVQCLVVTRCHAHVLDHVACRFRIRAIDQQLWMLEAEIQANRVCEG